MKFINPTNHTPDAPLVAKMGVVAPSSKPPVTVADIVKARIADVTPVQKSHTAYDLGVVAKMGEFQKQDGIYDPKAGALEHIPAATMSEMREEHRKASCLNEFSDNEPLTILDFLSAQSTTVRRLAAEAKVA